MTSDAMPIIPIPIIPIFSLFFSLWVKSMKAIVAYYDAKGKLLPNITRSFQYAANHKESISIAVVDALDWNECACGKFADALWDY
jgi:hypothetical protein